MPAGIKVTKENGFNFLLLIFGEKVTVYNGLCDIPVSADMLTQQAVFIFMVPVKADF